MIGLYDIAQRELAKDLIFEVEGESVILSIKGVMLATIGSTQYSFSFVEVSENEFVIVIQLRGYAIYVGIESDEGLDEDVYVDLFRELIIQLLPAIELLLQRADRMNYREKRKADIILDDGMSAEMKEFFYRTLSRHMKNLPIYDQTEVA
ncbi:hypothetical protein [Palaeococcus ferrophilus]|uniref:hypothetical protein n=1 Tax=Palaeococcus ferrophilus TaxID=83868 RepID=UPI00064E2F8A|nr:hypothetical protein [Palaeococcus ferrophilus]